MLNKIVLKFKSREIFTIVINKKLIVKLNVTYFFNNKFVFKQKIIDVILFVTTKFKITYNNKHKLLRFRFEKKFIFVYIININYYSNQIVNFVSARPHDFNIADHRLQIQLSYVGQPYSICIRLISD